MIPFSYDQPWVVQCSLNLASCVLLFCSFLASLGNFVRAHLHCVWGGCVLQACGQVVVMWLHFFHHRILHCYALQSPMWHSYPLSLRPSSYFLPFVVYIRHPPSLFRSDQAPSQPNVCTSSVGIVHVPCTYRFPLSLPNPHSLPYFFISFLQGIS